MLNIDNMSLSILFDVDIEYLNLNSIWNLQYFLTYKLGKDNTNSEAEYATYFLNYVGFAAQIPNVLFNWVSVFLQIR